MYKSFVFWLKIAVIAGLAGVLVVFIVRFAVKDNEDVVRLKQEKSAFTEKYRALQDSYDGLEQKEKDITQEYQHAQVQIGISAEQKDAWRQKNETLSKIVRDYEHQFETFYKENLQIKEERKALQKEYEQYRKSMSSFDARYAALEKKCATLKKESEQKARDYAQFKGDYDSLLQENSYLKNEGSALSSFVDGLHAKIKQTAQAKNDVSEKMKEYNREMHAAGKEKERLGKEYEKALTALENQTERYRVLEIKYKAVHEENKQLLAKTKAIPRKLSELNKLNKQLSKDKARLHYNLGVFYTQQGDYRRALSEFNEVLSVEAGDADTHYNLGVIYSEHIVDKEKAAEHFQRYLGLTPRDKDSDIARKYLLIHDATKGK